MHDLLIVEDLLLYKRSQWLNMSTSYRLHHYCRVVARYPSFSCTNVHSPVTAVLDYLVCSVTVPWVQLLQRESSHRKAQPYCLKSDVVKSSLGTPVSTSRPPFISLFGYSVTRYKSAGAKRHTDVEMDSATIRRISRSEL